MDGIAREGGSRPGGLCVGGMAGLPAELRHSGRGLGRGGGVWDSLWDTPWGKGVGFWV